MIVFVQEGAQNKCAYIRARQQIVPQGMGKGQGCTAFHKYGAFLPFNIGVGQCSKKTCDTAQCQFLRNEALTETLKTSFLNFL